MKKLLVILLFLGVNCFGQDINKFVLNPQLKMVSNYVNTTFVSNEVFNLYTNYVNTIFVSNEVFNLYTNYVNTQINNINIFTNTLVNASVSNTWVISLTNGPCSRYVQNGTITNVEFSPVNSNYVYSQRVTLQTDTNAITWPASFVWSEGTYPTLTPSARNVFVFDVEGTNVFAVYLH